MINQNNSDMIKVAPGIVETIIRKTVSKVQGVDIVAKSITDNAISLFGKKRPKIIEVFGEEENLIINLHLAVEFGNNIPLLSRKIKEKVKEEIESTTPYLVAEVKIFVDRVNISKDK